MKKLKGIMCLCILAFILHTKKRITQMNENEIRILPTVIKSSLFPYESCNLVIILVFLYGYPYLFIVTTKK